MRTISLRIFALFTLLTANLSWSQDAEEAIPNRGGQGTVSVILEPPGSEVYLDGESLGKAPIENKSFRSGRFDLIVIDQGKELIKTRFNVWPDSNNVYNGKTVMPFGNVIIKAPEGQKCEIQLDGDYAAMSQGGNITLNKIRAGSHLIGIKCGKGPLRTAVVDVLGEQTVNVDLTGGSKSKKKK
jgi:hypothetical protein